ncbi:MAG TPA: aspartate/glutamate racemase family protein [Bacteroidales bacterium]|nr:aspartate/glutamate racemase family protein [Bacteroidales bacterium]
MKTIGLIGGISWQSTQDYYRIINESIAQRTDNRHAGRILIDSLDFGEIGGFLRAQDLDGLASTLLASAKKLETAGADMVLICANTMHFLADRVQQGIGIPLVHIIDETIRKIREKGLTCVGLLGTRYTMEKDFYKDRLRQNGIAALVPGGEDMAFIDQVIFRELFRHYVNPESKSRMLQIIDSLAVSGAQGIILGCTEIPIMIRQEDCKFPVFDTTEIHAMAAVERALD